MTQRLLPLKSNVFLNELGQPFDSPCLYFYEQEGGSALVPVYSDPAGVNRLSYPLIPNPQGKLENVFVPDDQVFTIVLRDRPDGNILTTAWGTLGKPNVYTVDPNSALSTTDDLPQGQFNLYLSQRQANVLNGVSQQQALLTQQLNQVNSNVSSLDDRINLALASKQNASTAATDVELAAAIATIPAGGSNDGGIRTFVSNANFPLVGDSNYLYVDRSSGNAYFWDTVNNIYQIIQPPVILGQGSPGETIETTVSDLQSPPADTTKRYRFQLPPGSNNFVVWKWWNNSYVNEVTVEEFARYPSNQIYATSNRISSWNETAIFESLHECIATLPPIEVDTGKLLTIINDGPGQCSIQLATGLSPNPSIILAAGETVTMTPIRANSTRPEIRVVARTYGNLPANGDFPFWSNAAGTEFQTDETRSLYVGGKPGTLISIRNGSTPRTIGIGTVFETQSEYVNWRLVSQSYTIPIQPSLMVMEGMLVTDNSGYTFEAMRTFVSLGTIQADNDPYLPSPNWVVRYAPFPN